MAEQGDLFAAKAARDQGIAQVSENAGDFMTTALQAFLNMKWDQSVTGEDIRLRLIEAGIAPHHPNAWGALTRALMTQGWIWPTGHYRTPKDKKSHARQIRIYWVHQKLVERH